MENRQDIIDTSFEFLMDDRFGRYAKYIILDRALPDVRDGLKPVQRRILYAMVVDGNIPKNPYRKSAKTVGLVIGNYHPHGDSSVYEAMVRMSQSWKNNHMLVDMQGNNGSIDDDPAAAMRYTEARLSPYGFELSQGLNEDTVDFIDNFDDTDHEPTVLPGMIPNLLINGATGIAAGYATNIPPHNINEILDACVLRINQPTCTIEDIMSVCYGPDFPTGGVIVGKDEIYNYFATGKGRLILRATIEVISKKTTQQLVITEIPYEVVKANLVRKIDDLKNNKSMDGFLDVRDESDRNGLKVVVDIKPDADPEVMKALLYKHTDAQVYYNVNLVAIDQRQPKQMSLIQVLDAIIAHQKEIITRQSKFRIKKLQDRIHIVEGLIKAISILDEVIALIRQSNDKASAKVALIEAYDFTDEQAEAIVSLRLYRLTNTDIVALREEFALGVNEIEYYQSLLNSETLLNNVIIEKLRVLKETFHQDRRSTIVGEVQEVNLEKTQIMANERVWISVSQDGYVKRVSLRSVGASSGPSGYKENDRPVGERECDLLDTLVLVLSDGAYAYIPVYEINEAKYKDVGDHFSSIVKHDANVKVISGYIVKDFDSAVSIMIVSKKGFIKQTMLQQFHLTRYSKTSTAMNLTAQDEVVASFLVKEPTKVSLLSKNGYLVVYDSEQVPLSSTKSRGVKAINLSGKDYVVDAVAFDQSDEFALIITHQMTTKRVRINELREGNRPYKGDLIAKWVKSNPAYMISLFSGVSSTSIDVVNHKHTVLWFKDVPIKSKEATFSSGPIEQNFMTIKGLVVVDYIEPTHVEPLRQEEDKQTEQDSEHIELMQFEIK